MNPSAVTPSQSCSGRTGLATLMWTVPGGAQETGGPHMRDPRHPRHSTDDFKEADSRPPQRRKAQARGHGRVRPRKSAAERRVKSINATGSPRAGQPHAGQDPDPGARARGPQARMEVDVLKQAAPIYARKRGPWRPTRPAQDKGRRPGGRASPSAGAGPAAS